MPTGFPLTLKQVWKHPHLTLRYRIYLMYRLIRGEKKITDHRFDSGCFRGCPDDHSQFLCVHWINSERQCDKLPSQHSSV